jgi:hypothetical protein
VKNKTFYVIGSGPTLDHIDPSFFIGTNVIAVNEVGVRLGLYNMDINVYTFSHYHYETFALAEMYPGHQFHLPEGDKGFAGEPTERYRNVTFYPHYPTVYDFDPSKKWPENGILVGSTSVHGAMHLACKLGATNIILVGVDCGFLDGKVNHSNYVSGNLATTNNVFKWLARWEQHLREVKQVLTDEYGVRIYSLNPFLNLNLEGHKWDGAHMHLLEPSKLCKTCGGECADLH